MGETGSQGDHKAQERKGQACARQRKASCLGERKEGQEMIVFSTNNHPGFLVREWNISSIRELDSQLLSVLPSAQSAQSGLAPFGSKSFVANLFSFQCKIYSPC